MVHAWQRRTPTNIHIWKYFLSPSKWNPDYSGRPLSQSIAWIFPWIHATNHWTEMTTVFIGELSQIPELFFLNILPFWQGPYLTVLRCFFWLYIQKSFLAVLGEPYEILGWNPGQSPVRQTHLPAVLSLQLRFQAFPRLLGHVSIHPVMPDEMIFHLVKSKSAWLRRFLVSLFRALWLWRQCWELATIQCFVWTARLSGRAMTMWEMSEEEEQSTGAVIMHKLPSLLCIQLWVNIEAFHKGLVLFPYRNDLPWKVHLADEVMNMSAYVCMCMYVCTKCVRRLCGKSFVPWPLPYLISKENLMHYTWSVWYSDASDRLSEKLRKFSWYSEQTIS